MEKYVKISLFLVILISSVSMFFVIWGFSRMELENILENQKKDIHQILQNKFLILDQLLLMVEKEMEENAKKSILAAADILIDENGSLNKEISSAALGALAREIGLGDLYYVNSKGVVFHTSFPDDLHLNLFSFSGTFAEFLQSIYGKGEAVSQRTTVSVATGKLMKYVYYSPLGSDFILEGSVNLRRYIENHYSEEYYKFLFEDFFLMTRQENRYLEDIDIFIMTSEGPLRSWSLIHEGKRFDRGKDFIQKLLHTKEITLKEDHREIIYTFFRLEDIQNRHILKSKPDNEPAENRIVRKTQKKEKHERFTNRIFVRAVYDFSILNRFTQKTLGYSLLMVVVVVFIVFLVSGGVFKKYIIERIRAINKGLHEIARGNYAVEINIRGNDDLTTISENIYLMKNQIMKREKALFESRNEITEYAGRLEGARNELEKRVIERTKALSGANETLKEEIEKRIRFEEELHARRIEAESASRAKTSFLAAMSHELRTPMNAIMGMTELALTMNTDKKLHGYLETVKTSAAMLMQLLNSILDFTKIESGDLELNKEVFRITEVVEGTCDLFAQKVFDKSLEMNLMIAKEVPGYLTGDRKRLAQVLENLVGNAVKFTQEGEVEIRVTLEEEKEDAAVLLFAIRDSGIGMSQEVLDNLFVLFFQADNSSTRRYDGTGLGLAVSRQLIRMMDGDIRAESEPGKGSTFFFRAVFGITKPKVMALPMANENHAGKTIGVITPFPGTSANIEILLKDAGFSPLVPEEGKTFGSWDCVILDGGTSLETLTGKVEELHENCKKHKLNSPVVLPMVSKMQKEMISYIEENISRFWISKPVKPSVLIYKLNQALGNDKKGGKKEACPEQTGRFPGVSGAKVLIVEDNHSNQEVMREILRFLEVGADIAGNGKEAIAFFSGNQPAPAYDLVFMDVHMPQMDGYETTRKIKEISPSLPVIGLSAANQEDEMQKCFDAGMDDFISKPVSVEKLVRVIRKWALLQEELKENEKAAFSFPGEMAGKKPSGNKEPADIPGIHMESAMDRLMGNRNLLDKLVKEFVRDHGNDVFHVEQALQENNIQKARTLTHNLKGVAANLSANGMLRCIRSLEKAIAENQQHVWKNWILELQKETDKLRAYVETTDREAFQPEAEKTPKKEIFVVSSGDALENLCTNEARNAIAALNRCIRKNSPDSEECFKNLKELIPGSACSKELEELEISLSRFDFKQARAILKDLTMKLGVRFLPLS